MSNPFWKWFGRREGNRVYRHELTVTHRDGTKIKVTVESAHAEYVAQFSNLLRKRFAPRAEEAQAVPQDKWKAFEDFLAKEKA